MWRDTFDDIESTEVGINYTDLSASANTFTITWKSNAPSGYNRYAMRIFGYID